MVCFVLFSSLVKGWLWLHAVSSAITGKSVKNLNPVFMISGSIAICVGWLLPEGSVPGSLGGWNNFSHKHWV